MLFSITTYTLVQIVFYKSSYHFHSHELQDVVDIMSVPDPGFKKECSELMAEYDGHILKDAEYKMQDVPREKPKFYLATKNVALLCQWEAPRTAIGDWTKVDGQDAKLKLRLNRLVDEWGVLGYTETDDNVVFRFIKCKSIFAGTWNARWNDPC